NSFTTPFLPQSIETNFASLLSLLTSPLLSLKAENISFSVLMLLTMHDEPVSIIIRFGFTGSVFKPSFFVLCEIAVMNLIYRKRNQSFESRLFGNLLKRFFKPFGKASR